jgi:hypothetical protein
MLLKTASAASLTATVFARVTHKGMHASEKVKIAFIGVGGTDSRNIAYAAQAGFVIANSDLRTNFRQTLADPSVNAVYIATPEYCRADITVEACKARKDVYVETPAFVSVEEGSEMLKVARQYQCVVQAGTVERSGTTLRRSREIVKRGDLGDVKFCRGVFQGWRNALQMVDTVQFVLDEAMPISISRQASPAIMLATYRYPRFIASFESPTASLQPGYCSTSFHGDKASLTVNRDGLRVFRNGNGAPELQEAGLNVSAMKLAHWKNFLDCIRTRARPHGDIEACLRTHAAAQAIKLRPVLPEQAKSGMLTP